jgi:tellurite resistance protein
MASQQTVLQIKVLSLLGWVDGKFDETEHDASREILMGTLEGEALAAELKKMGATLPTKAEVLAEIAAAPADQARAAIKSGFELARADGYLHHGEFAMLLELSRAAGLSEAELNRLGEMRNLHQAFLELEKLY